MHFLYLDFSKACNLVPDKKLLALLEKIEIRLVEKVKEGIEMIKVDTAVSSFERGNVCLDGGPQRSVLGLILFKCFQE